jgi:hypothetical protein
MNPQSENNFSNLDIQLDRALATYTPAEPRPGLEQRILANLAANIASNPEKTAPILMQRPLVWAIAASLLAAASITGFLLHHPIPSQNNHLIIAQSNPPVPLPDPITHSHAPQPATALPARRLLAHSIPGRASDGNSSRQPVPAPDPLQLTSQERELARLAQLIISHPNVAASLIRLQANTDKPLETAPIRVEPLTIKEINIPPIDIDAPRPQQHPFQSTPTL